MNTKGYPTSKSTYIVPSIVTYLTFAKSLLLTTNYLRVSIYLGGILLVLPTLLTLSHIQSVYTIHIPYPVYQRNLSLSLYTSKKSLNVTLRCCSIYLFPFPFSFPHFVIIRAKKKTKKIPLAKTKTKKNPSSKFKKKIKKNAGSPISQEIYRFRRLIAYTSSYHLSPVLYLWIPS